MNAPKKRPRGRPSKYTKALAERICKRISEGRSLRSVCSDVDVPVTHSVVLGWVLDSRTFADRYGRASGLRAEARFDELMDIADKMEGAGPAKVNGLKAKADVLKWVLSKMLPHRFSDKMQVEQSGEQKLEIVVRHVEKPLP